MLSYFCVGNIPPLVRLLQAYIQKASKVIVGTKEEVGCVGIDCNKQPAMGLFFFFEKLKNSTVVNSFTHLYPTLNENLTTMIFLLYDGVIASFQSGYMTGLVLFSLIPTFRFDFTSIFKFSVQRMPT